MPRNCVQEIAIGTKVWDNKNVSYEEYNNYETYVGKKSAVSQKPLGISIWSAGANNAGEENINRYSLNIPDDGGYNLFRAVQSYTDKPSMNAYKLKYNCLQANNGRKPNEYIMNNSKIIEEHAEKEYYKTNKYYGLKPQNAILTSIIPKSKQNNSISDKYNNSNSYYSPNNKIKRFYLEDDGNKRKKADETPPEEDIADTFFIKTLSNKTNSFSACVVTNPLNKIEISENCDYTNKYHKWKIDYTTDKSNDNINSKKVKLVSMSNKSDQCLDHYYDKHGISKLELVECDKIGEGEDNNNWQYNTLIKSNLPQKSK